MNVKQQEVILKYLTESGITWNQYFGMRLISDGNTVYPIFGDETRKIRETLTPAEISIPVMNFKDEYEALAQQEADLPECNKSLYNPPAIIRDFTFFKDSIGYATVSAGMTTPLYNTKPKSIWQMIKDFWKCEGWQ